MFLKRFLHDHYLLFVQYMSSVLRRRDALHFLSCCYTEISKHYHYHFPHAYGLSVQFSSVTQSCPALCDLMNRSMPGLPVHHHLLESTQTHIHRVRDAIQPSHPLSSPSPPAPNPSQPQSLFQ